MLRDQFGHEVGSTYTFVPITVAGVTFKNGRRHRQTILRSIYWKDDPYQTIENIDLVPTIFEGQPAVEIWVSSKKEREMIGYVPKEEASYVHSRMDSYSGYFSFEVYGGGTASDGTKRSYGASLTLRFVNDPYAIINDDSPVTFHPTNEINPLISNSTNDHKRAYELFKTNYSHEKTTWIPVTGTSKTAIMVFKGKRQHYCTVVYYPSEDAIECYSPEMKLFSTTRKHSVKISNPKKNSSFIPILIFIVVFLFLVYLFAK